MKARSHLILSSLQRQTCSNSKPVHDSLNVYSVRSEDANERIQLLQEEKKRFSDSLWEAKQKIKMDFSELKSRLNNKLEELDLILGEELNDRMKEIEDEEIFLNEQLRLLQLTENTAKDTSTSYHFEQIQCEFDRLCLVIDSYRSRKVILQQENLYENINSATNELNLLMNSFSLRNNERLNERNILNYSKKPFPISLKNSSLMKNSNALNFSTNVSPVKLKISKYLHECHKNSTIKSNISNKAEEVKISQNKFLNIKKTGSLKQSMGLLNATNEKDFLMMLLERQKNMFKNSKSKFY